jgi:dihydrofolate reductase
MRKVIVLSMITLDGVLQGPGAPEEDTSGNFKYGGWVAPFDDQVSGKLMKRLMEPKDLLLGRKTFEIWEGYWPQHEDIWPGINNVKKYVMSTQRNTSSWENSIFLNSIDDIRQLKNSNGSDLQVWGSSILIQSLLKHDLVDELWLMIHPITLGQGKKLFVDGAIPAAFRVNETLVTPNGVTAQGMLRRELLEHRHSSQRCHIHNTIA